MSLSLCMRLLLLTLLHVACNLIANCPHYGLTRGDAHESGQKAAPQSFQALLSRDEGQSVPEATILGRAVRTLLSHQAGLQTSQALSAFPAGCQAGPRMCQPTCLRRGLHLTGNPRQQRRVLTLMTSKGPVATGPRQAAEKPDPIDCSGVSCLPSPSSFPHRSLHGRAHGHQQHVGTCLQPRLQWGMKSRLWKLTDRNYFWPRTGTSDWCHSA